MTIRWAIDRVLIMALILLAAVVWRDWHNAKDIELQAQVSQAVSLKRLVDTMTSLRSAPPRPKQESL